MKTKLKYFVTGVTVAAALCTLLKAQTAPQPSTASSPSAKKSFRQAVHGQLVPYHGVISSVDKNAKTFTIHGRRESRVLRIIDGTSLTKAGQQATIDDLNNNDEVSGSYTKDVDGTLVARTVKIGPVKRKPTPTPTASPAR